MIRINKKYNYLFKDIKSRELIESEIDTKRNVWKFFDKK